ncbi:MAG TPA: TolC family outer membrane protein [Rhizomicrobium sp.]|jgi:outer membrane protein
MRLRVWGAVLAATAVVCMTPAYADIFTLNDALGVAYETNPNLDAQRASLRAVDEQVAQAHANWRPTINAGGTYGTERVGFEPVTISPFGTISALSAHPVQGQLIVSENIFRGGRTYAEIKRAKALVGVGRAQLIAQEQTTLLSAVTAYMNVVRDMAIVSLNKSNVAVLKKQRDETKAEFSAGSLTKTDVAQSEARLAGAQSALTTAESNLQTSRADFENAIGRPAETLEEQPALPKLPDTTDMALDVAVRTNPALIQAQANEKAADYAVDDALGALAPSISVQGQYQYSGDALGTGFGTVGGTGSVDRVTAIVGQLNVPIYQGGAEDATVRQAKELHNQTVLIIASTDRQVRDAVRGAWASFQSSSANISSDEVQLNADQIAFVGVQREQQVGGRTVLDVLNAEQELLNSQVALVTARRNTVVTAYQLLASEGKLTARDLGLKVRFYDPLVHYDEDSAKWFGLGD